jgi:glycogen synthase
MMRVLFWSDFFPPYIGGIENVAAGLLPALRDRGVEFLVVTSHRDLDLPDRDEWQGIPVQRIPFWRAIEERDWDAFLVAQRTCKEIFEAFRPDLVHLAGVGAGSLFCVKALETRSTRLLVSLHQEMRPSHDGNSATLLDACLRRADWVHAVSPFVLEQARARRPALRACSSLIYNFVEMPSEPPTPLSFDPARLLCLGRVVVQKGFDIAVDAFRTVAAHFPDVRMEIAGEGAARPALEEKVRTVGLEHRVDFTGWVDPADVPRTICRSSVVLMPSRFEGFGLVAAEAALMGRPVVAAAVGGLRDVIEPGRTGILVEREDPQRLAQAVCSLLARPARAAQMGNAARARAMELFDKQACVDQYEQVYHRAAGGSGSGER